VNLKDANSAKHFVGNALRLPEVGVTNVVRRRNTLPGNYPYCRAFLFRSCLKNAFWPNLGVGLEFSILEILKYSSGSKFTAALTLVQNPFLKQLLINFKPKSDFYERFTFSVLSFKCLF